MPIYEHGMATAFFLVPIGMSANRLTQPNPIQPNPIQPNAVQTCLNPKGAKQNELQTGHIRGISLQR